MMVDWGFDFVRLPLSYRLWSDVKNPYEINEEKNTIIRVSKNGLNNDGVNLIEAKIYMTLVQEYLLPELPNLRENKRYPE
jgi:hypothetical protein